MRATRRLIVVNICAKAFQNPTMHVGVTERTRFRLQTSGHPDIQTHRHPDIQTDKLIPVYPPLQVRGGIKNCHVSKAHILLMLNGLN